MARIVDTDEATTILCTGGVGVLPTDTLYGLVARAADASAVARLYALKQRQHQPGGTVIAASVDQLVALGIPAQVVGAVAHLWPNPVSVELAHAVAYLHEVIGRQAFRIPRDASLRALLARTGPLVTSSANHRHKPPATVVAEAIAYFAETVDFYVDGGDLSARQASTIVRVAPDGAITVIRPGVLNLDEWGNRAV